MHGVELSHRAFHFYSGFADAVAEVLGRQDVGTAEKNGGVAGTDDLLPLVFRIAVLHLADVLEEDCHGSRGIGGSVCCYGYTGL